MKASKLERIPEHMAPQKGDIRLFENPLLERLSKITPVTVFAVYAPIIAFFAWKSFSVNVPFGVFVILFFSGLAFWTLFEYLGHRFVFHFKPNTEFQKRVSFLFHGVHHQYPNDKKRLVMPITLSLAIAVIILSITWLIFGTWSWAWSAGFATGYLAYDMTHYSIHHFKPPNIKWLKRVWKSHIDHHFRDSNKGYGVSSAFWDRLFGTLQNPGKPMKTP